MSTISETNDLSAPMPPKRGRPRKNPETSAPGSAASGPVTSGPVVKTAAGKTIQAEVKPAQVKSAQVKTTQKSIVDTAPVESGNVAVKPEPIIMKASSAVVAENFEVGTPQADPLIPSSPVIVAEPVFVQTEPIKIFEAPLSEAPASEVVSEPVLAQEPPPVAKPDLFIVYKDRSILGVVEEGSATHLSIEEHIASEMRQWIEDFKAPLDDRGLLWLNIGKHARNYKSWSAYFVQNGLAPRQPKYRTKMDYWRSHMDASATDEEVVARFAGRNSTYHVVPIRRLEETI